MSEIGGLDIGAPDEGMGGAPEQLSDAAKKQFAGTAQAIKKIRKEERRSKKRDDQVAQAIIQFLKDEKYSHLFVLISRLVARDCPSIFILAILSLIHEGSRQHVEDFLTENEKEFVSHVDDSQALTTTGQLDADMNKEIAQWIIRMQLVLSVNPEQTLLRLMIDEKNIDGTVLQLTTFVMKDFFDQHNRSAEFEKLQPLTASILQTVFEPFLAMVKKAFLEEAKKNDENEDEE